MKRALLVLLVLLILAFSSCGNVKRLEELEGKLAEQQKVIEEQEKKATIENLVPQIEFSNLVTFELNEDNGPHVLHKVTIKQWNQHIEVDCLFTSKKENILDNFVLEYLSKEGVSLGSMTFSCDSKVLEYKTSKRGTIAMMQEIESVVVYWSPEY